MKIIKITMNFLLKNLEKKNKSPELDPLLVMTKFYPWILNILWLKEWNLILPDIYLK